METVKVEIEIDKKSYDGAVALCRRHEVSFSRHVEALIDENLTAWGERDDE